MAEPSQNGTVNQQPSGQAGGQPSGQQQQSQQPQEPTWLSKLTDEAERKEAKEGWLRDADYRRKTMEIAERQKQWESEKSDLQKRVDEFNRFSESYQPFYQRLQQHWDKIGPILEGKEPQSPAASRSAQAQNLFEDWDTLAPQDQAKRLSEYQGTQFGEQIQQLKTEFNQALAMREQYYQNYLNILTDAFQRKMKDPNLDMNAFMARANAIQWGKENPLELAYQTMTSPDREKAIEEAAYKRGQEDKMLEFQNQQHNAGALQSQTVPFFKAKPQSRDEVTEAARRKAIEKGLPW